MPGVTVGGASAVRASCVSWAYTVAASAVAASAVKRDAAVAVAPRPVNASKAGLKKANKVRRLAPHKTSRPTASTVRSTVVAQLEVGFGAGSRVGGFTGVTGPTGTGLTGVTALPAEAAQPRPAV